MIITFDVDGVLIDKDDKPRMEIINFLKVLARHKKNRVIVWSGGGEDYARLWVARLKLDNYVYGCASKMGNVADAGVDLAIDDMEVNLAKVNLKV